MNLVNLNKFPVCVSLLNFSELALKCLRSGKLNAKIKEKNSVIDLFNNLYY